MRTLWRGLVRIVFWSFDRGTWPYDLAVAVIVVFVLFSPRSWFNDRPSAGLTPAAALVELRDSDPDDGTEVYRVNARLLAPSTTATGSPLEEQLVEAVRKNSKRLHNNRDFEVVRIAPVRARDGVVEFYDVCIRP